MRLGLFPLPLFLLPGGITKLRIFEPRYVRLVKESMATDSGFVLAMKDGDAICRFGTHVKIVDFETLPDGLLGITIRGASRVSLSNIGQEEDGLWVANADTLPAWQEQSEAGMLGEVLEDLFEAHPEHAAQYRNEKRFDDMLWVCQRWLEVLPLANSQRQWFLAQQDLAEVKQFISLLLSEENS
ncbi:LON peptidase substrate-binding domain-containing protein [Grimontia hollisae]|uniref:LON peptidase substrate-binding domain-containing protein n=1 Tax=Grimontia hollisae TaxID=673 RepID=UPI0023DAC3AA|nr:LON peptidase substrate-binding domain-containing protein [Grimontia hollisae]MDF2184331.1 LON peptidase substrate-binding domain-containing protein [Grimontia hollisae]